MAGMAVTSRFARTSSSAHFRMGPADNTGRSRLTEDP
jgi:hypothetical protein